MLLARDLQHYRCQKAYEDANYQPLKPPDASCNKRKRCGNEKHNNQIATVTAHSILVPLYRSFLVWVIHFPGFTVRIVIRTVSIRRLRDSPATAQEQSNDHPPQKTGTLYANKTAMLEL